MNSYSYNTGSGNVLKWDYAYNAWNRSSTTMGGFLVGPYKPEIHGESMITLMTRPLGLNSESPLLMGGLGCAVLTVIGVAANKYKKAKSMKSDDFIFEKSNAVDNVVIA